MSQTIRPRSPLALAAGLLSLGLLQPQPASALGVGAAELRSYLGETLDVRLPVLLDGSEPAGELQTRLLPAAAYAPLGLEPPRLDPGAFEIELVEDGGRVWLVLQSRRRVAEPLLVLLLETSLGSVRIVHELALMLEPSPLVAEAAAPAPPAARLRLPAPLGDTAPLKAPTVSEAAPLPPTADANRYGPVAEGETLRRIAERVRPEPKYGIRRVMTALLLANPEAFDAARHPHVGAELVVPSPRAMLELDDQTISATVGPRHNAGAAAGRAAPEPAAAPPVPEPQAGVVRPVIAQTTATATVAQAGLRLSLRLSPASREALAAAIDAPPAADRPLPAVAAEASAAPVPQAEATNATVPAAAAVRGAVVTTAGAQIADVDASARPSVWGWLIVLVGVAAAGAWWRRFRVAAEPRPAAPAAVPPEAAAPAVPATLREHPVRMRVVGGRKPPEVVALQDRVAQLSARPGVSQRTLTLASAYLDSGNLQMAGQLLDELEAQPLRGSR